MRLLRFSLPLASSCIRPLIALVPVVDDLDVHPASMGPRPFGRGQPSSGQRSRTRESTLQWGRDLSAADRAGSPARYPRASPRFNGAATFRPRTDGAGLSETLAGVHASMGPRPFGRGQRWAPNTRLTVLTRFNGAATFRPRTESLCVPNPFAYALLQWGRDLSAADSWNSSRSLTSLWRFNGAATFRPRTVRTAEILRPAVMASMGPRPFGRGQGCICRDDQPGRCLASMGPRPFGRGQGCICRDDQPGRCLASMGPRPFGRGQLRRPRPIGSWFGCFNGAATFRPRTGVTEPAESTMAAVLQWGRDLSAADSLVIAHPPCTYLALQWGRDLSAADSRRC